METELNIKEEVQDYDIVDFDAKKPIIPRLIKSEIDDTDDIAEYEEPYDEHDLEESSDEYANEAYEEDSDYEYKSKRVKKEPKQNGKTGILCLGCDKTFKSQPNLNKHLGHFDGCRQFYEDSGNLPNCFKQPRKKPTGDIGDFACEKCDKKFTSEGGLNR